MRSIGLLLLVLANGSPTPTPTQQSLCELACANLAVCTSAQPRALALDGTGGKREAVTPVLRVA